MLILVEGINDNGFATRVLHYKSDKVVEINTKPKVVEPEYEWTLEDRLNEMFPDRTNKMPPKVIDGTLHHFNMFM
jgi:hypothetical protein